MAFTSQTFVEQGVGGGGITSTADSLLYIRSEDRAKVMAAWGLHKAVIVSALDTEGTPSMVMFSNGDTQKLMDYHKLATDPMVIEALKTGKTKTLYTIGWFNGQKAHYFNSGNGIHIEMVNPYVDNRDLVQKIIDDGDSVHEGYVPLGLYSDGSEYESSLYLDAVAKAGGTRETFESQRDAGKTADQIVGESFTRSYDAPGVDPSMYWLGEDF